METERPVEKSGFLFRLWRFIYWVLMPRLRRIVSSALRILPISSERIGPPKGFYESTLDWKTAFEEKKGKGKVGYRVVYPHSKKGKAVSVLGSVITIPGGRLLGDVGTIISPDDYLLTDLFWESGPPNWHKRWRGSEHTAFNMIKLPPVYYVDGAVAVLSEQFSNCYYHWMLRILPRIHLYKESGFDIDNIDKFIINRCDRPFIKETIKKLAIPEEKIIESSKLLHVKARQLIATGYERVNYKWQCDFLRQIFLGKGDWVKTDSARRIYISRSDASMKRIINEEEVIEFLKPFGFKPVILSTMSVAEQALLFSEAEMVIGRHGSGLTNLVFCNPGTRVIEFFPYGSRKSAMYSIISREIGLDHYRLLGKEALLQDEHADAILDINELSSIIKSAGLG